jgi:hypothetical protein
MSIRSIAANTYRCVVPIGEIWPVLKRSFPEGIFLGMGQGLIANAQVNDKLRFLTNKYAGAAVAGYTF